MVGELSKVWLGIAAAALALGLLGCADTEAQRAALDDAYQRGYKKGKAEGRAIARVNAWDRVQRAHSRGWNDGYDRGYDDGAADGIASYEDALRDTLGSTDRSYGEPYVSPDDGYNYAPSSPSYTPSSPTTEDFGAGNGYVVTCADGMLSDSGGIQEACSHHGGVP